MERLRERRAVVVGGTHGMGWATVQALVDEGAQVLFTGANAANVDSTGRALAGRAQALRVDVARKEDRERLSGTAAHTVE
jgi:NAD(P)-dependent dehydrogenase (short-subunit alcohol dehydrogenase family)